MLSFGSNKAVRVHGKLLPCITLSSPLIVSSSRLHLHPSRPHGANQHADVPSPVWAACCSILHESRSASSDLVLECKQGRESHNQNLIKTKTYRIPIRGLLPRRGLFAAFLCGLGITAAWRTCPHHSIDSPCAASKCNPISGMQMCTPRIGDVALSSRPSCIQHIRGKKHNGRFQLMKTHLSRTESHFAQTTSPGLSRESSSNHPEGWVSNHLSPSQGLVASPRIPGQLYRDR